MPARPEPRPDPVVQLGLTPLRNTSARTMDDAPERVVLEVDAIYPRWLGPLPRLLGARPVRRYEMTGLGLAVWRLVDDRRSLEGIIDAVAAAERLSFNEARLMVLHWLRLLSVRGLVVLGDRTVSGSAASG